MELVGISSMWWMWRGSRMPIALLPGNPWHAFQLGQRNDHLNPNTTLVIIITTNTRQGGHHTLVLSLRSSRNASLLNIYMESESENGKRLFGPFHLSVPAEKKQPLEIPKSNKDQAALWPFQIPNASFQIPITSFQIPNTSFQIPNTSSQIPNTSSQIPNTS